MTIHCMLYLRVSMFIVHSLIHVNVASYIKAVFWILLLAVCNHLLVKCDVTCMILFHSTQRTTTTSTLQSFTHRRIYNRCSLIDSCNEQWDNTGSFGHRLGFSHRENLSNFMAKNHQIQWLSIYGIKTNSAGENVYLQFSQYIQY